MLHSGSITCLYRQSVVRGHRQQAADPGCRLAPAAREGAERCQHWQHRRRRPGWPGGRQVACRSWHRSVRHFPATRTRLRGDLHPERQRRVPSGRRSISVRKRSRLVLTSDNHNSVNGIGEFALARGAATEYVPLQCRDLRVDDNVVRAAWRRHPRLGRPGLDHRGRREIPHPPGDQRLAALPRLSPRGFRLGLRSR